MRTDFLCPPSKKILLAHVGLSVCLSINNSRTPWPTFLKLCPHICPGQQRNPIDWITGSKVKVTRVKYAKTVSDCLSNNFQKWISSSYICATYFELANPDVQNICDKNIFRGHNVLQISFVELWDTVVIKYHLIA